jgi:hypothetical protein
MSTIEQRISAANTNAAKSGISFFDNGGVLVVERPGDPSSTTHNKVQKDLGPVTGTFASWCLDAATGVIETILAPNEEQKVEIGIATSFSYPEKPVVTDSETKKA